VPFHVPVPVESGSGGTAAWRGEGLPSVATKSVTSTFNQEYREISVITLASAELFRFGGTTEALLTAMVIADLGRGVDSALLDPANAGSTAKPASLTYHGSAVVQTGVTAATISADFSSQLGFIFTPGDDLVAIMPPITYHRRAAIMASAGMPFAPGYYFSVPTIVSSTSPKQITLVDLSNVAVSFTGAVEIDLSTEASVQADTAPSQTGIVGTGASMLSLLQTGLVGIRATLPASWHTLKFTGSSPDASAGCSYMVSTI
jgi:hypothetical protein